MRTLNASEAAIKLHSMRMADLARKIAQEAAERKREDVRRERERRLRERQDARPTPERLAKGDLTNKTDRIIDPNSPVRDIQYQQKDHLESVRKYLTPEGVAAIARFVVNAEYAHRTRAITANYEGMSGGGYGPRHGGVPDSFRKGKSVYDWMINNMPVEFAAFANTCVVSFAPVLNGRPLSPREIVGIFFSEIGAKDYRNGSWITLWGTFSWTIMHLEKELEASLKGERYKSAPIERMIAMERDYAR